MTLFDLKVVLEQTKIDESQADAIYGRCKDGTLITDGDTTYLDFAREAGTLDEAVNSAIADVNATGFRVRRIEIEADSLTPQHI